ncbi:phytanoyl-CoA dioxygenase family protein [Paenibacillus glycanilyticus]|uniref:phytanoyl-CoA dioxygenase family protein n=1 Tax=Paenibacillus glycanilyticus TaxID=126569 RepID=UPI0013E33712|nr:phytanoyl-CoA dioxygenase family protein [Paenibacillus glycanilyticus]
MKRKIDLLTPQEISERLYRYESISKTYSSLDVLGEEEWKEYKEAGYLAVDCVLGQQEVQNAIEALMSMIFSDTKGAAIQFSKPSSELKSNEERELAVRKVHQFVECDDRLRHVAYHPAILRAVEAILGEKPRLVQDMALLKPPHGGGEKPWHQDMAYGNLAYNKPVVGVWIALDEAALDNGCMHVLPGSHADGATPHYAVRDWQLCDTHVAVEKDVAVPLQSGGLLFFHGLLKHGTPYNLSPKRRRALQFHYVAESAEKLSPQEYKRTFTNEMSGAEC